MRTLLAAVIAFCCVVPAMAEEAVAPAAPAAKKEVARPPTAANKALDQLVTLNQDGELFELLRLCDEKGVQYIVKEDNLRVAGRLMIKVKDLPLREVLSVAARASGLKCEISKSGLVTLLPDPTQTQSRTQDMQRMMLERMQQMRNKRGGRRPRGEEQPEQGFRPRRDEDQEPKEAEMPVGKKEGDVF